ncbi:hypothetical protein GCM10017786_47420 [Amycolatopsis deserti]|uniref:DUF1871 family protein n=1 Tax=Amycolatopsis deserti TaxID=185696 RepID=A0ABQ3J830_9PSEU|nr:hypothetical protein [Amycolatopsis deserti]GHF08175.1 hypothetical protein GCM10017786_47420 [Amycolatopsis deserti]
MLPVEPIRALLNEWDPIGVADCVDDEYDCLIWPLLSRLRGGADAGGIREFLRHEMADHYGLAPDVDAFAERLVAWWRSR